MATPSYKTLQKERNMLRNWQRIARHNAGEALESLAQGDYGLVRARLRNIYGEGTVSSDPRPTDPEGAE